MQRSEHKRCDRHYIIRYLNRLGIVSAARVLFEKACTPANSRNERESSEGMGRSDLQTQSFRYDTEGRDIFGADRVDFIGNIEMYQLIRDTFSKQGLEYRAGYYRTAWDRNGGARLITQATR